MKSPEYHLEISLAESAVDSIHDLFTHRETVDAWLHERMLQFLCPIAAAYPNASWLTIGDEGTGGWMLRQYGAKAVTASSISDVRLKKAADLGHLNGIEFEPAGDFIYRLSERDIFRMAAVRLPWFAIKTFNNFYLPWLAEQHRESLLAQLILKLGIGAQDALSSCRLMSPGLCVGFVATSPDTISARDALRASRFRIVSIPRNPYTAGDHVHSDPQNRVGCA